MTLKFERLKAPVVVETNILPLQWVGEERCLHCIVASANYMLIELMRYSKLEAHHFAA